MVDISEYEGHNPYMTTHDDLFEVHVNIWGRKLAESKGIDVDDDDTFRIESRGPDGGGCSTCGWGGDEGGMELVKIPGHTTVAEFAFSEIGTMLRGIWAGGPDARV
jgi:hypothetical protein